MHNSYKSPVLPLLVLQIESLVVVVNTSQYIVYSAIELTTRVGTMVVVVKSFVKFQQRRGDKCCNTEWIQSNEW
jgi:hypothetical protein